MVAVSYWGSSEVDLFAIKSTTQSTSEADKNKAKDKNIPNALGDFEKLEKQFSALQVGTIHIIGGSSNRCDIVL